MFARQPFALSREDVFWVPVEALGGLGIAPSLLVSMMAGEDGVSTGLSQ